jgi:TPR repeat protein
MSNKDDNSESLASSQPRALAGTDAASVEARAPINLPDADNADTWYERGNELWKQDKPSEAVASYRRGLDVDPNHVVLQFTMGYVYDIGWGVPRDDAEAVRWYRKAAELGHAGAQYSLGWMYDCGRGISQDYTQAAFWYEKAAEQGHVNAQFDLSWMFKIGLGVPKDDTKADGWNRKAHNTLEAARRRNSEI